MIFFSMVSKYKWHILFAVGVFILFAGAIWADSSERDYRFLETWRYFPLCVLGWAITLISYGKIVDGRK
jgi:hypothetical protein